VSVLSGNLGWRLEPVVVQYRGAVALVRRIGLGPLLLRILSGCGAVLELVASAPEVLRATGWIWFAVIMGVLVGLAPRTRLVGLVGLVALALWLIRTAAENGNYSILRLSALGVALYVTHACAALAAALPYDATIGAAALARRITKIGITAAVGVGFGVGSLIAARVLPALHGVAGALAGSTAAVLIVGLLVWSARRSF
jgi:hypothetical protein